MEAQRRIERLRAEARYHGERLALYRARVLTARPASPARLRELERAAASAKERLDRAMRREPPA